MEHNIFQTDLGDIHYWISRCSKEKPWLVFLPGLSADHTLFDKQAEFFTPKCNCFVLDAPAHGLSRPFTMKFSMGDMADYLYRIFTIEEIQSPVLIGQSLGGYISQMYIDKYPDSVSGFVSIDSCSLSRKYYTSWELALLKRTKWMYMGIPWKLLLKLGIAGTSTSEYGRQLMEKIWSVYEKVEFCELADHGFRILAEAVEAKEDYPIICPVLLLCGEKDAAGSARRYNREWAKRDGHKLVWLKNAGHNSNTDAPYMTNRLIWDFVQNDQKTTSDGDLMGCKHLRQMQCFNRINPFGVEMLKYAL